MAEFHIEIDDHKLRQLIQDMPDRLDEIGRKVAEEMTTDMKLSFGTSPSAPGDPPGVDTGALRASVSWKPAGDLTWNIHDGVEYGVTHELGLNGLPARPWMRPVFMEWENNLIVPFVRQELSRQWTAKF